VPVGPAPALAPPAARVDLPSICLIVTGVVNLLLACGPLFIGAQAALMPPEVFEEQIAEAKRRDPNFEARMAQAGLTSEQLRQVMVRVFLSWGVVGLLSGLLTTIAAIRMRLLRSYTLAVVGSVVTALPCVSCTGCCGLGEVVGIWALVILVSPDVRLAFR
jgi:hypothetical protein